MSKKQRQPNRTLATKVADRDLVDLGDGLTAELFEGGRLGPGMSRAADETILRALRGFDPDRPWMDARLNVLPMLPRLRPFPVQVGRPIRTMLSPGLLVGFGLDLGPALTVIDDLQVGRWGVDVQTVSTQALENVRRLAAGCDPAMVVQQPIGDTPVAALQTGVGIAASLILVPDALARFFGRDPALVVAPMRDLILALPHDVDREEAAWVALELEALDPNCLHLGGFRWDGAGLIPETLEGAAATA